MFWEAILKKEENKKLQDKNNKRYNLKNQTNANMSEAKHITDFTSSKEIGEDATQYGEFMSSFFGWVSLDKQKEETHRLENITKDKKYK